MELTCLKAAPPTETFKALFEIFWRLPINIALDSNIDENCKAMRPQHPSLTAHVPQPYSNQGVESIRQVPAK